MEFVIKFDNQKPVPRRINTRSRKGCFNCRKRKKKCDEVKPCCSTCEKKGIPCVWPDDRQRSLPDNYVVPKTTKKNNFVLQQKCTPYSHLEKSAHPRLVVLNNSKHANVLKEVRTDGSVHKELSNELQIIVRSPSPDDTLSLDSPLQTFVPFHLQKEQLYLQACVNGFIRVVGPQHTHPLLTTSATFTPYVMCDNHLMEMVSVACGASFLSFEDPNLKPVAKRAYDVAAMELNERVKKESGLWLFAASQLMVLCSKNIDICVDATVQNLNNTYSLIKRKLGTIEDNYNCDNLMVELENSLIHFERHLNVTEKESERMFVESFVYNYSVSLLSSKPDSMPSPFVVFRDLRKLLRKPILSCDVAWMNNPVVGAALDAFEFAAKASYLVRHMSEPCSLKQAKRLLDSAMYYPVPVIPAFVLSNPEKYERLKDSVTIAEIVIRASLMILRKIIDVHLEAEALVIQSDVKFIISRLRKMKQFARVKVISTWALFVTGFGCVTEDDRECILKNCEDVKVLTRGHYMTTVENALKASWEGNGLDSLFDGELLGSVVM